MNESEKFNFGNDAVAKAYDSILVPILFEPWAKSLIKENQPWVGNHVLELACGTGVVTKELAQHVLPTGKVTALDINKQMIDLAKLKCVEWANHTEFIEGSADSLDIPNQSIEKVVCQQGFQFFPNKEVVAQEIYRVLKPRGKAILSTWCSVSECEIFGAICESLEALGLNETSQLMQIPFNLTQNDLLTPFNAVGFSTADVTKHKQKMYLEGGISSAITVAYSTPIGPKLKTLSDEKQEEFKKILLDKIKQLNGKDGSVGSMVSHVLNVEK